MAEKKTVGVHYRKSFKPELKIPVNLERALLQAGRDPDFARALLADPVAALCGRGYQLSASERCLLLAIPASLLSSMIERIAQDKIYKGRFASRVAAAVAGTMVLAASACDASDESAGMAPDLYPYGNLDGDGMGPDLPLDASDAQDAYPHSGMDAGGMGPDLPLDAGRRDADAPGDAAAEAGPSDDDDAGE